MAWRDLTDPESLPVISEAELVALCGPVDHGRYRCIACGQEFDRTAPGTGIVGFFGDYCCLACLYGREAVLTDEDIREVPDGPD